MFQPCKMLKEDQVPPYWQMVGVQCATVGTPAIAQTVILLITYQYWYAPQFINIKKTRLAFSPFFQF